MLPQDPGVLPNIGRSNARVRDESSHLWLRARCVLPGEKMYRSGKDRGASELTTVYLPMKCAERFLITCWHLNKEGTRKPHRLYAPPWAKSMRRQRRCNGVCVLFNKNIRHVSNTSNERRPRQRRSPMKALIAKGWTELVSVDGSYPSGAQPRDIYEKIRVTS
jgi:hypothetical protein